jgi:hypothetical protein
MENYRFSSIKKKFESLLISLFHPRRIALMLRGINVWLPKNPKRRKKKKEKRKKY